MAELTLKVNEHVKWQIPGGFAFGKIVTLKDEIAGVELPTGSIVPQKLDSLIGVDENTFNKAVYDIIESLSLKYKKTKSSEEDKMSDAQKAELIKVQSELDKINEEIKTLKAQLQEKETALTASKQEVEKLKTSAETSKQELDKAQTELAKISRDRKAESRFTEIKSLNALAAIDADEGKAKEKLADMTDAVYATTVDLAKGFKKLTDQSQTAIQKVTDQSQTGKPKTTEQTVTAKDENADALKDAKADKDADLATAATAEAPVAFQAAMAKAVNRNRVETEKDSK